MNINESVLKAINEQLPSAVGSVLKDRLAQLDALEKKNVELEKNLSATNQQLSAHRSLDVKKSEIDSAESSVRAREKAVADRELKMSLLEQEKVFAREIAATTERMFNVVFANNTVRSSVHSYRDNYVQENGCTQNKPLNVSETKETVG